MKLSEMQHAWKNNQVTDRRKLFLWTHEMIQKINPEHTDMNRTGMNPRYRTFRLTQAETPMEIRINPNVMQWLVLDSRDDCVRYAPIICLPESPKHTEVVKGAITVKQAHDRLT